MAYFHGKASASYQNTTFPFLLLFNLEPMLRLSVQKPQLRTPG
jgi:hypothetical protein